MFIRIFIYLQVDHVGTWSWCSMKMIGMVVFLTISMIPCGWRVGMEYLNHKVLLHPRRAGANPSRCWLPVHYGEADTLDGSHRPSHHPLKGLLESHLVFPPIEVDVITQIDIGVPLLFWNELNFLSASHCRHSMRFEASQSAHISVRGAVGSCTTNPKKWEG